MVLTKEIEAHFDCTPLRQITRGSRGVRWHPLKAGTTAGHAGALRDRVGSDTVASCHSHTCFLCGETDMRVLWRGYGLKLRRSRLRLASGNRDGRRWSVLKGGRASAL